MALSIVLWALYLKLKWAAWRNTGFQSLIADMRMRFLIRTADGKRGRLFIFEHGSIGSLAGAHHDCDAALVWSDPFTALKVMLSGSEKAVFLAAARGKLKVEGLVSYIQWFNDAVKLTW
ncbi:MAG TPA: hypothetical protein PLB81_03445 [Deltaproteobacteria bacterium]|nr:hypothetical protein [Deltaproteobacteria bacterium]